MKTCASPRIPADLYFMPGFAFHMTQVGRTTCEPFTSLSKLLLIGKLFIYDISLRTELISVTSQALSLSTVLRY